MRNLKFRAWDEIGKVMHNDFSFIESGSEGNDWVVFISDKRPLHDPETNPFKSPDPFFTQQLKKMQFTGLKDKDGTDIYEGDILYHKLQGLRTVIYPMSECVAAFGLVSTNGMKNYLQDAQIYTVMGNIYEDPEILEIDNA